MRIEQVIHQIGSSSNDPLLLVQIEKGGTEARILYANNALTYLFGYNLTDLMNKNLATLCGPQTDAYALAQLILFLHRDQANQTILILHRKDGQPMPVTVSVAPLADKDNNEKHLAILSFKQQATPQYTHPIPQQMPPYGYMPHMQMPYPYMAMPQPMPQPMSPWSYPAPYPQQNMFTQPIQQGPLHPVAPQTEPTKPAPTPAPPKSVVKNKFPQTPISHEEAITELGKLALAPENLQIFLNKATTLVARALHVPMVKVQEFIPEKEMLLLVAAHGFKSDLVGNYAASWAPFSKDMYNLRKEWHLALHDIRQDESYQGRNLLTDHNVVSCLYVMITGLEKHYGVIAAHTTEPHEFTEQDIKFLQHVAEIIATNIKRRQAEEGLKETEKLVSLIFDSADVGICLTDESGRMVRVNTGMANLFGYTQEDMIGREFTMLIPFSDRARARQDYRKMIEKKEEVPNEMRAIRQDGKSIDIHITMGRLRKEDGRIFHVITVEDITSRKKVENKMRLFQQAVLNAHDAIFITEKGPIDPPGPRIIFANEACAKLTGYSVEELTGSTPILFEGKETDKEKLETISESMKANRPVAMDLKLQNKNGESFWADLSYVPVVSNDGKTQSWLALMHDITERKITESNLRHAKENADKANKTKSDFLANINHELRTPLNAIIGFSDVMQKELFGELGNQRYLSYAKHIHESGLHLLDLVNDTLDLSKIESGMIELHEDEVDLKETIDNALALLEPKATEGQVKLKSNIKKDLPWLFADESKLKRILFNLLSNAVKFTLPKGEVSVDVYVDTKWLTILVKDTGIGIKKENIGKLYEPYTQIDSEQSRKHKGTGLGIPMVKALTELHDGEMKIESEENEGTSVYIRFPISRVIRSSKNKKLKTEEDKKENAA